MASDDVLRGHFRKPLGAFLLEMELLYEHQLQEGLAIQKANGGQIGQRLVELGYVSEEEVALGLAAQFGRELIDFHDLSLPSEAIKKVPGKLAKAHSLIPVRFNKGVLTVAMAHPERPESLSEISKAVGCEVLGVISIEGAVTRALQKYYGVG